MMRGVGVESLRFLELFRARNAKLGFSLKSEMCTTLTYLTVYLHVLRVASLNS